MKVFFIGAGPGAEDLITVRGAKLLESVEIVMYAGSLVPKVILKYCRPEAKIHNTASLSLNKQVEIFREAKANNLNIARLHSGDPAIYGAMAEQIQWLKKLEIEYEITPGVSSFTAAAAVIKTELTKPEVSQTIILTRVSGRASKVPELESLEKLASHKSTMCIFLSGCQLPEIVATLMRFYPAKTPLALVQKATWKIGEKAHRSSLDTVLSEINLKEWELTSMLIVGDVLSDELPLESKLYSGQYSHRFRQAENLK